MGSLMSGWSSTVLGDDKKVRLMRNRSLTKEEVDAFWRQHGGRPDNSGQQGSPLGSPRAVVVSSPLLPSPRRSDESQQEANPFQARRMDAVRSLPPSPLARGAVSSSSSSSHDGQHYFSSRREPSSLAAARADGSPAGGSAAADSPSASCDWWTRSSWAFLNEPPHKQEEVSNSMSGSGSRARNQFHVARIVTGNA